MRKNKLRTVLTAFSVAWGIFILIVLLGSGNGLKNAVMTNFERDATNYMSVDAGWTSMDYNGLKKNRRIQFDNRDIDLLENQVDGLATVTPILSMWSSSVSNGPNYGSFSTRGVYPSIEVSENLKVTSGRFINDTDVRLKRKVATIGTDVVKTVFPDSDPVGQYPFPLHPYGQDQHLADRPSAAQHPDDVANGSACAGGDHRDTLRHGGDRLFVSRIEQPFLLKSGFKLFESDIQVSGPFRLDVTHIQLVGPVPRVDGHTARADHAHAVFRSKAQPGSVRAVHDAAK